MVGYGGVRSYVQVLPPGACHSPLWPYRFLFLNPVLTRIANRLLEYPDAFAD